MSCIMTSQSTGFLKIEIYQYLPKVCVLNLCFVLKVFSVSCHIRVPYLRSENNLRRFELLSELTVHNGATFFSQTNLIEIVVHVIV